MPAGDIACMALFRPQLWWREGGSHRRAIAKCYTRYPCTAISKLPPQVPERQSAEVVVSQALPRVPTRSIFAIVDALEKAK